MGECTQVVSDSHTCMCVVQRFVQIDNDSQFGFHDGEVCNPTLHRVTVVLIVYILNKRGNLHVIFKIIF